MNACSIKGTPYEKEYSTFLKPSSIIFVWNANKEQPLDKLKVGTEVIDNPLYKELLEHPVTEGKREEALKIIADTFFADFTTKYHQNELGSYSLNQVLDYLEQRQRILEDVLSQKIQSINIPSSRAINFYNAKIAENPVEIHFSEQESQEIFETFEYLLGESGNWAEVQKTIINQRNTLISQISPEGATSTQIRQLKALSEIAENFDLFVEWYDSQEAVVGIDELEAELGETEDWKTKEKSQAQRASKRILALVTSLPSYRKASIGEFNFAQNRPYNKDEKVMVKGSLLGLPKSGDFQKNWNLISTALSGITDYTKQYDMLKQLALTHPQFNQLLKRIPDPRVKGSTRTIKQIMFAMGIKRIFSNPETIAVSLNVSKEKGIINVTQQIKGYRNVRNLFAQLDKQYFAFNQDYAVKGESGIEFNLDKFVSDFSNLFNNNTVRKVLSIQDVKESAQQISALFKGPNKDYYITTFSNMLNALGVGMSSKDYLLPTNIDKTVEMFILNYKPFSNVFFKLNLTAQINRALVQEGKFPIVIKGPLTYIANSDNQVFPDGKTLSEDVRNAAQEIVRINAMNRKGIRDADTIKQFLTKKETEAKRLIDYISSYDIELRPSSYLTADDKKKFTRGPWFYLTQTTKAINDAKNYEELINTPGFERFDYRKNPDMLGSIWLKRLFGLPTNLSEIEDNPLSSYTKKEKFGLPVDLEIRDYNGVEFKKMGPKVGKTTTDLHPGDKVMQDFLSFFQSTEMENIRFGDKSSSFSVFFSNPVLGEKIYVPIVPSRLDGVVGDKLDLENKKDFVETMSNYLASEFTRVLDLIENPQQANTTYHKQGKSLFIFEDILPPALIKAVKEASTKEQIQSLYEAALEVLPSSIDTYFTKSANQLVSTLVKTLSSPISKGNTMASDLERLVTTVNSLNKMTFMNNQLLPKNYKFKVTKENITYLAENYLKNGFINNIEFMKVFVGDMANFDKLAKDAREVFKRIPFTSSPGIPPFWDSALQEFFNEDLNQDAISIAMTGVEHKFSPIVRTVVYNDVISFTPEEFEEYKKVYDSGLWDSLQDSEKFEYDAYTANPKEADAQGVITLDFYRNYLISIEGWSEAQERAFNDQVRIAQIGQELKSNPTNSEALIEERSELINKQGVVPFPPLKLGHYGPIVEDPKLNALHKYSLIPVVPSAVIGKQMEKQLELMYKNQVDYYTFKSGSKMADFGEMIDFYKEVDSPDGKIKVINDGLSDRNITSIHLQNLRQQQYQAPKFKGKSTLSTQMMKLVFGDFFEFGELSEDFSEPVRNQVAGLYDKFKTTINDMVKLEQIKLERKLGIVRDASGNITDLNQLQLASYIVKEFEKKEIPESLRKFIQVDDKGNLKYPLDAINDRTQLESLLLNFINNKIINQKINGESYIQVAGTGFETRRFAKPTQKQLEEYGADELQFYRVDPVTKKTLPMEVKVGFNSEKHSGLLKLMYKEKPIGNIETLNEILKSNSALAIRWREQHKDLITMVGVRIPVQGFQSMEHVVIKEFLPESSGAVMILPAQIVVKTGGDYDIDKLTFFETAYNERGETVSKKFNLVDYKSKLEAQRDLKKEQQRLLAMIKLIKEEISDNEAYTRRKELKQEISKLDKEVKRALKELNELLDRENITEDDKKAGLDNLFEKKDPLQVAIENLRSLNQTNDFSALSFISQIRKDLKEVEDKISEVNDYKKAITNDLVSTLRDVLSIGELYDYLVAPNNNNILTSPEVMTGKGRKISTSGVFNPMTSWRIYAENILSKNALGIDAKINTMQKEFQLANLKFKSNYLNTYYLKANRDANGNISLGGKKGQDDNRISKVLSEFVNGHVDIAKEDWIILLGMNQETSPLAHAMILAGTPVKDVIQFIKSTPIQLVLEIGNRAEIDLKVNSNYASKNSAIRQLILVAAENIQDKEIKDSINNLAKSHKENKVKGRDSVAQYVELLLDNPKINKYLQNFNPTETLENTEENSLRSLAYLLQFGVIIAQQEAIRELTSLSDFNTANYRTTFQSVELVNKEKGLKDMFNPEAIDFMFKESALAQFNVGSFTLDIMSKVFPLSDSPEVHDRINRMLQYSEVTGEEDRRKAINTYKNNLLYTYIALFAKRSDGQSYLEYYRGKEGIFTKGTPNNMLDRYQELASNPDLRTNFVFSNLYVDEDSMSLASPEIVFNIRNIEIAEYTKEYRASYLEGLNHADEKVRTFFKDLATGSFMQSGQQFRQREVSTVVPFEAYVNLTKAAYDRLIDMKDNNPELFGNYLSLVGFGTTLAMNSTGPLLALPSFLSANYKGSIDIIGAINPELVAKMQKLENAVKEGIPVSAEKKAVATVTKVNPLVAAGVKPTDMAGNASKDIQMAEESTQFIGFQSGNATVSSTNKYREAWGNKANTGKYTAEDVVMVSGSGLFRGVTEAQIKETLTKKYKPLLELAVQTGASFRVGNQYAKGNLSDQLIAQYLKLKGYQEEVLPGYSRWTPKVDLDAMDQEMFTPPENPIEPTPPKTPSLPVTDNGSPSVDTKLDTEEGTKGNMQGLEFTEVSCQLSLGL